MGCSHRMQACIMHTSSHSIPLIQSEFLFKFTSSDHGPPQRVSDALHRLRPVCDKSLLQLATEVRNLDWILKTFCKMLLYVRWLRRSRIGRFPSPCRPTNKVPLFWSLPLMATRKSDHISPFRETYIVSRERTSGKGGKVNQMETCSVSSGQFNGIY